jgi:lipopolysaccharide export system protein LptC
MNAKLSAWFPLGLLIILAALTYWLDHAVQPPPAKRDGSTRHDPDYIVGHFIATRLGPDGNPLHLLRAAKMEHYPDDDTTHLTQPHFTRLDKAKPPLHIRSETGLVSKDGETATFTGKVQVLREALRDKSALTLNTEHLVVIPDKDHAYTDRAVTIQDANTIVTAVGLQLDNKNRTARLLSRVKGRYEKSKKR